VRESGTERIDARAVAREGQRRPIARDDRAAPDGDARVTRIAGIGVERRPVDENEPKLAAD
jgi:hypothetical protein